MKVIVSQCLSENEDNSKFDQEIRNLLEKFSGIKFILSYYQDGNEKFKELWSNKGFSYITDLNCLQCEKQMYSNTNISLIHDEELNVNIEKDWFHKYERSYLVCNDEQCPYNIPISYANFKHFKKNSLKKINCCQNESKSNIVYQSAPCILGNYSICRYCGKMILLMNVDDMQLVSNIWPDISFTKNIKL